MSDIITIVSWSGIIVLIGFIFGIGFGFAWWLWGFGKHEVTINFPKKNYLVLREEEVKEND